MNDERQKGEGAKMRKGRSRTKLRFVILDKASERAKGRMNDEKRMYFDEYYVACGS